MALQYSGAKEGHPLPMVLEMMEGQVDRGACIRELSQYPEEFEYLYLPMSFISPDGAPRFIIRKAGLCVRVIPVRINVNLSARTVEELLGQKKRMHCAAFRFLLGELKRELARRAEESDAAALLAFEIKTNDVEMKKNDIFDLTGSEDSTVEELLEGITRQVERVLAAHDGREERDYADGAVYEGLVTEMLDARRWAVSKLRLWLQDRTQSMRDVLLCSLRDAHRKLTAYLTRAAAAACTEEGRRAAALEVCKERGLLRARVDETNDSGEAPLVAAATDGASAEDMRLLVAAGCTVNGAEGEASPAAIRAAKHGHADALGALLEAKANVHAFDKVFAISAVPDMNFRQSNMYLPVAVFFVKRSHPSR